MMLHYEQDRLEAACCSSGSSGADVTGRDATPTPLRTRRSECPYSNGTTNCILNARSELYTILLWTEYFLLSLHPLQEIQQYRHLYRV